MPRSAIGLGSNLGDAAANVEAAIVALASFGRVEARSSLYRSAPWGEVAQPDFINAAALLATDLAPRALLVALKACESELGRVASYRWGPRRIDLDILTYGELQIDEPDLIVPHARLFERAFALAPLAEIEPAFEAAYEALAPRERASVQRIRPLNTRTEQPVWDETLERVRSAAEFCVSAGLTRFRIDEDDLAIEVRRTPRADGARNVPAASSDAAEPAFLPSNGSVSHGASATTLKADFVGIVRLSRPAVGAGSIVPGDRELAYVESLGIRNPIRSGGPCRVAEVFVSDGEPVGFGQPLISIEPHRV